MCTVALLLGRSASESGRLRHGEKILGWGRPPPEGAKVAYARVGGVGIGGATDNNGVAIRNGTISGFRIGIRFLGVAGGSVDHVTFFNNTEVVTAFHHAAVRDSVFWGNTTTLDVGGPSHITGNHITGAETAIIARCPSLILGNTIVGALVLNEAVAPCKVENNALTP